MSNFVCDPCFRSNRGNPEAAYLWTTTRGDVIPLCINCCAWWRHWATDDPSLQADHIRQLGTIR